MGSVRMPCALHVLALVAGLAVAVPPPARACRDTALDQRLERAPSAPASDRRASWTMASVEPEVFVLEGGTTVIFQRVPGATMVGVEEIFPVGLIHDPRGVTQGTHLLEHLRCMGATDGAAPGETYARLSTLGPANAETMGDVTHYDLVVPPDDLALALDTIAGRRDSLQINDATVAQEAPRCASEVEGVTAAAGFPGFKFALAAAAQHWRHGRTRIRLSAEIAAWAPEEIDAFRVATCRADNLVVAIAGDLDLDRVRRACELALNARAGDSPRNAAQNTVDRASPLAPIDWHAVPRDGSVAWDSDAVAVFVAYPPPEDPAERLALTLWSTASFGRLQGRLAGEFQQPMLSTTTYPVGDLPLMAFAAVPDGADPTQAGQRLAALLESSASDDAGVVAARQLARMLVATMARGVDAGAYRQGVEALVARFGEDRAQSIAIGNVALQMGLTWHALGPYPPARLNDLLSRDDAWWCEVVGRCVTPERRIVTTLRPASSP